MRDLQSFSSAGNSPLAASLNSSEMHSLSKWSFGLGTDGFIPSEIGETTSADAFQTAMRPRNRKSAKASEILKKETAIFLARRNNWAKIAVTGLFITFLATLEPMALIPEIEKRDPYINPNDFATPTPAPHKKPPKKVIDKKATPTPAPSSAKNSPPKLNQLHRNNPLDSAINVVLDLERAESSDSGDVHIAVTNHRGDSAGNGFAFVPTLGGDRGGSDNGIDAGAQFTSRIRTDNATPAVSGRWVKVSLVGSIAQYQVRCLNNPGEHTYGNIKIKCLNNVIVAAWQRN